MWSIDAIWKRLSPAAVTAPLPICGGNSLPYLFVLLNPSPWMGLCTGGLRVYPKQTHLLKMDLEYILNNNGFTRQDFNPSFFTGFPFFQKLNPDFWGERFHWESALRDGIWPKYLSYLKDLVWRHRGCQKIMERERD